MYNIIINDIKRPVVLQEYIDNKDSTRVIGLKSLTYWAGWYNVLQDASCVWGATAQGAKINTVTIPAGLYTFARLSALLSTGNAALSISVNKTNGKCTLIVADGHEANIAGPILKLLGFDMYPDWLSSGSYTGANPVDFTVKALFIYLKQVNSSGNLLNGSISHIVGTIPVSKTTFGDFDTVTFPSPMYRKLQSGTIDQLEIEVRDADNNLIDNHGLPIFIEFNIK